MKFTNEFNTIRTKDMPIFLRLIEKNLGNSVLIPFYYYDICLENGVRVGKISLRIGHNFHSYYNGNIGFEIEKEFRGRRYAYMATTMLIPLALHHKMKVLILTCNEENNASSRTFERLGAIFRELVKPPKEYFAFYEEMPRQQIFELRIGNA